VGQAVDYQHIVPGLLCGLDALNCPVKDLFDEDDQTTD
jgi:hypothetical protein